MRTYLYTICATLWVAVKVETGYGPLNSDYKTEYRPRQIEKESGEIQANSLEEAQAIADQKAENLGFLYTKSHVKRDESCEVQELWESKSDAEKRVINRRYERWYGMKAA